LITGQPLISMRLGLAAYDLRGGLNEYQALRDGLAYCHGVCFPPGGRANSTPINGSPPKGFLVENLNNDFIFLSVDEFKFKKIPSWPLSENFLKRLG
jgi:hypothetical protein